MILASGWDGRSPLLDPFCGSETIAIEGALFASKIPPGLRRPFAFRDWPNFDAPLWKKVLGGAGATRKSRPPRIIASDRDAGALEAAQANAKRAGVADAIDFTCRAVSAVDPPRGPGWVITNPPHGVRLTTKKDLRSLYIRLGKVLQTRCPGWRVAMLCGSSDLARSTGINFQEEIPLRSGGLNVSLWKGRIA
jgi:putative N6-adenine-specific DNA methylase